MEKPVEEGTVEEPQTIGEVVDEQMEEFVAPDPNEGMLVPHETPMEGDDSGDTEEAQDDAAGDDETPDGEEESLDEADELDAILERPKDGAQKRIDKLTARLKDLEEKNAKLESNEPDGDTKEKYSPTQLKTALKTAMEDGNSEVVWAVMEYMVKDEGDKRVKSMETSQRKQQEKVIANQQEWTTLVNENKEFTDPDSSELFNGSRADLNLAIPNSLLNRIAYQLYTDNEKGQVYQTQGGQRLAVADAFKLILKAKRQKGSNKEVKKLTKRLSREKRKNSLSRSKVSKQTAKPVGPMSESEKLASYISERRKPMYTKK